MNIKLSAILVTALLALTSAFAQDPSTNAVEAVAEAAAPALTADDINFVDTGFMIICSALVLLMTPGLAFFYGGLVRRKNVLSILMQCFMCMCLMTVLWVVVGYSIAFGDDQYKLFGDPMQYLFFKGVTTAPQEAGGIPHLLFAVFQGMFAIITPGLIVGAFAERMKFSGFLVFSAFWLLLCYAPVCHWAWGGGLFHESWLVGEGGVIDFAGGTVVHINAGIAALVAAFVLGKRKGYPEKISPPHNLPFAVLGAGLLWFGWFGFNAGSELAVDGVAVSAFAVTHVCAAMGGFTWAVIEWIRDGKPTVLGIISGVVSGLVAITPACGDASIIGALILGFGGALVAYISVAFVKEKLGYDDTLDVWGIHGMAGIFGAVAIGFLTINGGSAAQALLQLKTVIATIVYTGTVSFVLLKVIDLTIGLRVDEQAEKVGMDLTDHAESAYTVVD